MVRNVKFEIRDPIQVQKSQREMFETATREALGLLLFAFLIDGLNPNVQNYAKKCPDSPHPGPLPKGEGESSAV
jgi:hypothetical protein